MQFIPRDTRLQPFINFDFERFFHPAPFYFIYGIFDFRILDQVKRPVLYFELEEPNRFCVMDESFHHLSRERQFWRILTLCPYTADWLNQQQGNTLRIPVFYPFNEQWIPGPQEKSYDAIYTDVVRGGEVDSIYNTLGKFNSVINADKSDPRVTHSTFDFREKYRLIAASKVSVVHNLLFLEPSHQYAIRQNPGWENNLAFSQIETGYAPQIKSRVFEAAFCRSLILCRKDPWNLIERYFEPGKHFIYYEKDELEETLREVLDHYDDFLLIVEAAFQHASAHYTTTHFFQTYVKPIADSLGAAELADKTSPMGRFLSQHLGTEGFSVVELGARPTKEGNPHLQIMDDFSNATYTGFDVDPAECERWNRESPSQYRFLPVAVGYQREHRLLYVTQQPFCTSLYRPNHELIDLYSSLDDARLKSISAIETQSLDELTDQGELGPIDFLKLDIQGAELDALKGGVRSLARCLAIVSEVLFRPIYEEQPLFGDVCRYLENQGFIFFRFVDRLAGVTLRGVQINNDPSHATQQLWSDALFIRNPAQFPSLDEGQLLKLAYIGHLYGCPDITFHCLSQFDAKCQTSLTRQIFAN